MELASAAQPVSWDRFVESRTTHLIAFALAVLGGLAGAYIFVLHVTTDPAADVHAYYDAGARLNAKSIRLSQVDELAEAHLAVSATQYGMDFRKSHSAIARLMRPPMPQAK